MKPEAKKFHQIIKQELKDLLREGEILDSTVPEEKFDQILKTIESSVADQVIELAQEDPESIEFEAPGTEIKEYRDSSGVLNELQSALYESMIYASLQELDEQVSEEEKKELVEELRKILPVRFVIERIEQTTYMTEKKK
jgi:hypothetical protein